MGGGTDVAHPPVPAALSRLRSDESKSTVDSPMSTSSAGPSGQAAPPRPATHLPPASGGADGPAGDSSDEEGAHRPPSPERPPPAPAAPPAPPFAQPTMQLAQGLRPFSAAPLPAAAAPRTTRVSDEDRKELHRARLEAQAAAEKERAETEAHVRGVLVDPDTSIYDILMVEFALQPDIPHEAGAMRALYLKQLKAARDFDSVPRQSGVANMATLREEHVEDDLSQRGDHARPAEPSHPAHVRARGDRPLAQDCAVGNETKEGVGCSGDGGKPRARRRQSATRGK